MLGAPGSSPRSVRSAVAFAGFRFPPEVIVLAVRWYLRFGLSYRDVKELLAERGIEVDQAGLTHYRVLCKRQRHKDLVAPPLDRRESQTAQPEAAALP